ncbi:MAG TPA: hypothetical protein VLF71_00640 [Candidatus Saccharimonadales bacterium]|nr:hypothetical protein [Candidatus Saccharimonadales bacterium]
MEAEEGLTNREANNLDRFFGDSVQPTADELAEKFSVKKESVLSYMGALRKKGYVETIIDAGTRSIAGFVLTQKGKQARQATEDKVTTDDLNKQEAGADAGGPAVQVQPISLAPAVLAQFSSIAEAIARFNDKSPGIKLGLSLQIEKGDAPT